MDYSISQLLEDSKLRGEVLQKGLTAQDYTGQFACLDFSQSLLKNHRAVFDRLCELGGDDLLGKLLKKGGTCLTDDPNAAKQGVRPIKGTDKYFLKTNAGASTALGSILAGLAGWMDETDPEGFINFHTEGEDQEEPEEEPSLPPRRLSLVQKDGKYAFFDEDAKEFASFDLSADEDSDSPELSSVSEFALCRLMDEEHPEWGWKYQLTEDEDAKWGWIAADGRDFLKPCLEEVSTIPICLEFHNAEWEEFPSTDYEAPCGVCYNSYTSENLLYFLRSYENGWHMCREGIFYEHTGPLNVRALHISYDPRFLFVQIGEKYGCYECYEYGEGSQTFYGSYYDGILHIEPRTGDIKEWRYPAKAMSFENMRNAIESKGKYRFLTYLSDDLYAIQQEGWWAVGCWQGDEFDLLTPYAYTEKPEEIATKFLYHYILLDRFGKKGVFATNSLSYGNFVVPCEYEKIDYDCEEGKYTYGRYFVVRRMGYVGKIYLYDDLHGEWSEPLHREE